MDETPLEHERRGKALRLRAAGIEPYPWSWPGRVGSAEARRRAEALAPGATDPGPSVRVAGRLKALRTHGRTAFADLEDADGSLQLLLRADDIGEERYRGWLRDLDPGDILGAEGRPARSKRGEPSVLVGTLTLLAKAIAPPPEKFHGLKDAEERIRRRYLDLIASAESRQRFSARSRIVYEIRRLLDEEGFQEVETPILTPVAGGATAEPFVTHSRYLDDELSLRISIELYLKRLLVGGFERVYEIGRCFRNEDGDTTHNPEFSLLELYWAYADYHDMRGLVERLYERLGRLAATLLPDRPEAQAAARDFVPPFRQIDFVDSLEKEMGVSGLLDKSPEELGRLAREAGAKLPSEAAPGRCLDKLFEHYVEPTLLQPTFVMDYPALTTPLAKRHRRLPGRVERFEMFYQGFELANAYTELNDPDEQELRFREQVGARGEDRFAYDADFVAALRHGMPPATGIGIGIDRIAMALTGTRSIKEVILFPQTRRRSEPGA
ncbi:MAG: lysine--tRNA ligase [Thermoplasmata archaeon]